MNLAESTAVLSDIHGNRWALEAVLSDAVDRGVRQFVNLGDSLYGPLDPEGTARLLKELPLLAVSGNEDRLILDGSHRSGTLEYARDRISADTAAWLRSLHSIEKIGDHAVAFHGAPDSDTTYLLSDVSSGRSVLRSDAAIIRLAGPISVRWILCGHDHLPRVVVLTDGRTIVNPGSVGCPAFEDDHPVPHTVENGSGHARYAILEPRLHGTTVHQIALTYDAEAAARAAERNGSADWGHWIRTGRATRPQAGEAALG